MEPVRVSAAVASEGKLLSAQISPDSSVVATCDEACIITLKSLGGKAPQPGTLAGFTAFAANPGAFTWLMSPERYIWLVTVDDEMVGFHSMPHGACDRRRDSSGDLPGCPPARLAVRVPPHVGAVREGGTSAELGGSARGGPPLSSGGSDPEKTVGDASLVDLTLAGIEPATRSSDTAWGDQPNPPMSQTSSGGGIVKSRAYEQRIGVHESGPQAAQIHSSIEQQRLEESEVEQQRGQIRSSFVAMAAVVGPLLEGGGAGGPAEGLLRKTHSVVRGEAADEADVAVALHYTRPCSEVGAARMRLEAAVMRAEGPELACIACFGLDATAGGGAPALAWQAFAVSGKTLIGLELSGHMTAWSLFSGSSVWHHQLFPGRDPIKTPRCIGFDLVRAGSLGFPGVSSGSGPSAVILDAVGCIWFIPLPEPGPTQDTEPGAVPHKGPSSGPGTPAPAGGAPEASRTGNRGRSSAEQAKLGKPGPSSKPGDDAKSGNDVDRPRGPSKLGNEGAAICLDEVQTLLSDFTNLWMLGTSRPSGLRPHPQGVFGCPAAGRGGGPGERDMYGLPKQDTGAPEPYVLLLPESLPFGTWLPRRVCVDQGCLLVWGTLAPPHTFTLGAGALGGAAAARGGAPGSGASGSALAWRRIDRVGEGGRLTLVAECCVTRHEGRTYVLRPGGLEVLVSQREALMSPQSSAPIPVETRSPASSAATSLLPWQRNLFDQVMMVAGVEAAEKLALLNGWLSKRQVAICFLEQALSHGHVPTISAALRRVLEAGNPSPQTLASTAVAASYWLLAALLIVLQDALADQHLLLFIFSQASLLITGILERCHMSAKHETLAELSQALQVIRKLPQDHSAVLPPALLVSPQRASVPPIDRQIHAEWDGWSSEAGARGRNLMVETVLGSHLPSLVAYLGMAASPHRSVPFSGVADEVHAYAYGLLAADYGLPSSPDYALPREPGSHVSAAAALEMPAEAQAAKGVEAVACFGDGVAAAKGWEEGVAALACLGDDVPTALQHLMLGTLDSRVRAAVEALARRRGLALPDQAARVLEGIHALEAGGVVQDYGSAWQAAHVSQRGTLQYDIVEDPPQSLPEQLGSLPIGTALTPVQPQPLSGMVFPGWGRWSRRTLARTASSVQGPADPQGFARPYFQFAATWTALVERDNLSQCWLELHILRSHMAPNPRNPNPDTPLPPPAPGVPRGPAASRAPQRAPQGPATFSAVPPAAPQGGGGAASGASVASEGFPNEASPDLLPHGASHPDQATHGGLPDLAHLSALPDETLAVTGEDRLRFAVRHGRVREAVQLVAGMCVPDTAEEKGNAAAEGRGNDAPEERENTSAEGTENTAAEGRENAAAEEKENSAAGERDNSLEPLTGLLGDMRRLGWFTELSRARVEEAAVSAGLLPDQAMQDGGDPGPLLAFLGYMVDLPSSPYGDRKQACALLLARDFARARRAHALHLLLDTHVLALNTFEAALPFLEAIGDWPWGRWFLFSRLPQPAAAALVASTGNIAVSANGGISFFGNPGGPGPRGVGRTPGGPTGQASGGASGVASSGPAFADVAALCRMSPQEPTCSDAHLCKLGQLVYCPGALRELEVLNALHGVHPTLSGSVLDYLAGLLPVSTSSSSRLTGLERHTAILTSFKGDINLLDLLGWWERKDLRGTSSGSLGTLGTSIIPQGTTSPPVPVQCLLQAAFHGPSRPDAADLDTKAWESAVLEEEAAQVVRRGDPPPAALAVEQSLQKARPLAALRWFMEASKGEVERQGHMGAPGVTSSSLARPAPRNPNPNPNGTPEDGAPGLAGPLAARPDHLRSLQGTVWRVAVLHWSDTAVVSSCMALLAFFGLPTWPLRINVAVLRRLARDGSPGDQAFINSVAPVLAEHPCRSFFGDRVSAPTEKSEDGGAGIVGDVLHGLEVACLGREAGPCGAEARRAQLLDWALVKGFCVINGLPPSPRLLKTLAAADDWIHFLAEATTQSYPFSLILRLAVEGFASPSVSHHVCRVLQLLAPPAFRNRAGGSPYIISEELELFAIAPGASAEADGRMGDVLLGSAAAAEWPLVAISAACRADVAPMRCLIVWINAALSHVSPPPESVPAEVWTKRSSFPGDVAMQRALTETLRRAAGLQALDVASVGFYLIMPSSPIVPGLRFFQAFMQGKLSAADVALRELGNELIARQSYTGLDNVKWSLETLWSVADEVLSERRTSYCRAALLKRLVTISAPLVPAKGNDRYGLVKLAEELTGPDLDDFVDWRVLPEDQIGEEAVAFGSQGRIWASKLLQYLLEEKRWPDARRWATAAGLPTGPITLAQARGLLEEWREVLWEPTMRRGAWDDVEEVFRSAQCSPLAAGHFLVQQAVQLAASGDITPLEQYDVLKAGLDWLGVSPGRDGPAVPLPLLETLVEAVNMVGARLDPAPPAIPPVGEMPGGRSAFTVEGIWGRSPDRAAASGPGEIREPIPTSSSSVSGSANLALPRPGSIQRRFSRTASSSSGWDLPSATQSLSLAATQTLKMTEAWLSSLARPMPRKGSASPPQELVDDNSLARQLTAAEALPEEAITTESCQDEAFCGDKAAALTDLENWAKELRGKATPQETHSVVKRLVELGYVVAARAASTSLASPPVELILAEAAVAVLQTREPQQEPLGTTEGPPITSVVPPAVLRFLKRKGHSSLQSAQEVLDALVASCRTATAAGRLCRWADVTFRAASAVECSCIQVVATPATATVEMILLKGPKLGQVAVQFAEAYRVKMEDTVRLLAEALCKGLSAEYADRRGDESGSTWSSEDFLSLIKVLGDEEAGGNALLQILLERHAGLEGGVHATILRTAHACYTAAGCLEGLDVLLRLASAQLLTFAATESYTSLAKLATGLGRHKPLRVALDFLVARDQIEPLLNRHIAGSSSSDPGVRMQSAALLAAIERQRAGDSNALALVYQHFNFGNEAAEVMLRVAQEEERAAEASKDKLAETLARLHAMQGAITAAHAFTAAKCCGRAALAADVAVDMALKVQGPRT